MFDSSTILIIDDDDDDVETITSSIILLSKNCIIERATNGKEGLAKLQEMLPDKPALIILDINMPIMDGLTFLKLLRSNVKFQDITVCVLTTSSNENDRLKATRLGAHFYIKPPTDFEWNSYMSKILKLEANWVATKKRP